VESEDTYMSLNYEVRLLMMLQLLQGFSWAVQRPGGFNVVIQSNFGLTTETIGLISMCGMFSNIVGAPTCGLLADMVPAKQTLRVYSVGFGLRTLFHALTWPAMALLHGRLQHVSVLCLVVLSMFWETMGILQKEALQRVGGYNFGKVRLCAGIGYGLGSFLTGILATWLPSLDLRVLFLESMMLCLANAICIEMVVRKERGGMDHSEKAAQQETARELVHRALAFLTSRHVMAFFGVVMVMGLCEGVMMSYTYLRIIRLPHGTPNVMGLSSVCMIMSEIPFFYFSGALTRHFGLMKILTFALVCIFLRQAWNALLVDAWLLLPGELLHGITFSIANAAIVDHCNTIAPQGLSSTVQSVQVAIFLGLGQGSGALLGGLVIRAYGVAILFATSAYFALAWTPLAVAV